METKLNPNPNGCLAKALPDEPFFVLLARDPCAPAAICHWAELRAKASVEDDRPQDAEQLSEAFETAEKMAGWRNGNHGRWKREARVDWLIWSDKHGSWWRPDRAGYTRLISEAGRYTYAEALALCGPAGLPWETSRPIPSPELAKACANAE